MRVFKNMLLPAVFILTVLAAGCFDTGPGRGECDLSSDTTTYRANGGTFWDNSTAKSGALFDGNPDGGRLTRPGYVFAGWNSSIDGSGPHSSQYNITRSIDRMPGVSCPGRGAYKFYAQWTKEGDGFNVYYKIDHFESLPKQENIAAGTQITLPDMSDNITRHYDKKIMGWFDEAGLPDAKSRTPVLHTANYTVTGNTTLLAFFDYYESPETCTVRFNTNGGALDNLSEAVQQTACDTIIPLPRAAKTGQTLAGWEIYAEYSYNTDYISYSVKDNGVKLFSQDASDHCNNIYDISYVCENIIFAYPGVYRLVKDNVTLTAVWE